MAIEVTPGDADSEGPATPTKSGKKQYGMFSIVVIGMLSATQAADPGVHNVALPSAAKELTIDGSALAMVSSIGTLSLAATIIAVGAFADRIGVRKVIMMGLIVGIAGSLVSALSISTGMFLLGRAVTGIGMGALFGGSFSMVPEIAGKKSVATVIGQWTGLLYIFTVVISLVGAVFVGINWRSAYLLILALCVAGLILVPISLPETKPRGAGKFDFLGLSCLGIGMVGLLVAISSASTSSITSPALLGPLIAGIVFLALFVIVEKKSANAAFPIGLFKSPIFVAAVIAGIVWNFGESATMLQLSNVWQHAMAIKPAVVGIANLPLLLTAVVLAFIVGGLLAKGKSPTLLMLIGIIVMSGGMFLAARATPESSLVSFLPTLVLVGAGMIFVSIPQAREYVAQAPPKFLSAVVSSRTSIGQLGYALGLALTTTVVVRGIQTPSGPSDDPNVYANAFNSSMVVGGAFVLIGGIIAVVLLGIGLRRDKGSVAESNLDDAANNQVDAE